MSIDQELEALKARFPWLRLYKITRGDDPNRVEGLGGMLHLYRVSADAWNRLTLYGQATDFPTLTAAVEAAAALVRPLAPSPAEDVIEVRGWVAVTADGEANADGWSCEAGDKGSAARARVTAEAGADGEVVAGHPFVLRVPRPKPAPVLVGEVVGDG